MDKKKEKKAKPTKAAAPLKDDKKDIPGLEKRLEEMAKRKESFLKIYHTQGTNISETCAKIGINRSTFYTWRDEDAEFEQACIEIEESMIDYAESRGYQLMMGKGMSAVKMVTFFLETKGKKRGYSRTHNLAGHDGKSLFSNEFERMSDAELEELYQKRIADEKEA